jgi:hypothetical protein
MDTLSSAELHIMTVGMEHVIEVIFLPASPPLALILFWAYAVYMLTHVMLHQFGNYWSF